MFQIPLPAFQLPIATLSPNLSILLNHQPSSRDLFIIKIKSAKSPLTYISAQRFLIKSLAHIKNRYKNE